MSYRYLLSLLLFLIIAGATTWAQTQPLPGEDESVSAGRIYIDPARSNFFLSLNSDGSQVGGDGGVDYRLLSPLRMRASFNFFPDSYTYLTFGPNVGWRYFAAGFEGVIIIAPKIGFEPLFNLRFGEEEGLSLSLSSLNLLDEEDLSPKFFRARFGWALSDTALITLTYGFDDFEDTRGEHERDLATISYREDVDESLALSLGGGLVLLGGKTVPNYTLSLGATYRFNHGFQILSVPIVAGSLVDLSFGDTWSPPPQVRARSNFGENILDVVFLPPALVYIMDATVEPGYAYLREDDWRNVRKVYEEIPRFDLSLGGGILGAGGSSEVGLDYKFAGPYRVEARFGSAVSRFSAQTYYPILFRTFYHYGLFPFFPSGDWRFIGFGIGLLAGLPVGAKEESLLPEYPSLAPSLALRFGGEDNIFVFLDVGDLPFADGGISGAAGGVGMSLSDSTSVALMGGIPTYADALGGFIRPLALGTLEQALGEVDTLLEDFLGEDFLGGARIFDNLHLRLSLGLGTDKADETLRSPMFSLGISYKMDRLPEEVAVSELMMEAEAFEGDGEWAQATNRYDRIIFDYPDNRWISEVRFRAAQAYERQEMFDAALNEYRILAENFPSSQWNILSQITIGRRAVRDESWREAHKAFINVLAAQPTGRFAQEARYWAEYSSVKLEDWERRNIVLEEFAEFYPQSQLSDDALYLLGDSYFGRGRYSEAISFYRRALDEHPQGNRAAGAQMQIGYSHLGLDDVEAARSAFERVLSEYPDLTELVEEAKEQLARMEEIAED